MNRYRSDDEPSESDVLPSDLICSRCRMAKEDWSANGGKGVRESGEVYCCQGCVEDIGCTCDHDRVEPEEDEDAADTRASRPSRKRTS